MSADEGASPKDSQRSEPTEGSSIRGSPIRGSRELAGPAAPNGCPNRMPSRRWAARSPDAWAGIKGAMSRSLPFAPISPRSAPHRSMPTMSICGSSASHRLVKPHGVDLGGMFALLNTAAWTSLGPCPVERVATARMLARASGTAFDVKAVDKFPRMVDYVIPSDVRIADGARVRLGAYLAPGTIVMHGGPQLQRRHARHLHGRRTDQRRCRGGQRQRCRWRRLDHGNAVGRRYRTHHRRRTMPDRRERRHRHLSGR